MVIVNAEGPLIGRALHPTTLPTAIQATPTHLEEGLHLERGEPVPLLDAGIPLEEGPGGYPAADPLDGDHLTVGRHECSL